MLLVKICSCQNSKSGINCSRQRHPRNDVPRNQTSKTGKCFRFDRLKYYLLPDWEETKGRRNEMI